mmetsp:Transcript_79087/g.236957  ORF Transcript_79087/g.236957 Transcript_79087/m.236957 type:complete len:88 (-) Transcript_79087:678-941(-)
MYKGLVLYRIRSYVIPRMSLLHVRLNKTCELELGHASRLETHETTHVGGVQYLACFAARSFMISVAPPPICITFVSRKTRSEMVPSM